MEQQTAVRIEKGRGALTIFASYFSGTGKTFRMLEAATQVHRAGGDVVIGLLSCSQWPQTQAMAEPFESMPQRVVTAGDDVIYEIDLDACLKRRPQILLIDNLSHVNAEALATRPGYRDIEELLKAGIDVYTTVDIQHIESIQETVFEIFGAPESERIPDCVFDQAAHVEFIDMEPEQLQNRLKQGCGTRIPSAGCTLSQLNALRELWTAPVCRPFGPLCLDPARPKSGAIPYAGAHSGVPLFCAIQCAGHPHRGPVWRAHSGAALLPCS